MTESTTPLDTSNLTDQKRGASVRSRFCKCHWNKPAPRVPFQWRRKTVFLLTASVGWTTVVCCPPSNASARGARLQQRLKLLLIPGELADAFSQFFRRHGVFVQGPAERGLIQRLARLGGGTWLQATLQRLRILRQLLQQLGADGQAVAACQLFDLALIAKARAHRSEEHTSELQSRENLVCRLLP